MAVAKRVRLVNDKHAPVDAPNVLKVLQQGGDRGDKHIELVQVALGVASAVVVPLAFTNDGSGDWRKGQKNKHTS